MQLNHAITWIVCSHEMLHWLLAILVSSFKQLKIFFSFLSFFFASNFRTLLVTWLVVCCASFNRQLCDIIRIRSHIWWAFKIMNWGNFLYFFFISHNLHNLLINFHNEILFEAKWNIKIELNVIFISSSSSPLLFSFSNRSNR
jgi:hypothetical protein